MDIEPSWKEILKEEFEKPYFKELVDFVKTEYRSQICYPKGSEIFNAFNFCPFHTLKIVILGQDPYHGFGQAHGLSFSVGKGVKNPPSLQNIFTELQEDLQIQFPQTGNLTPWAQQGVMLLNATLTVRAQQAGSHQGKGWEIFTDKVIQQISQRKENVVFILWGSYAQKKTAYIDPQKHLILCAHHPSPLSSYRGFFGSKPFSQSNDFLRRNGLKEIDWQL